MLKSAGRAAWGVLVTSGEMSVGRIVSFARTTVVIAHRLSTIVDADRVVVLDEGRIVQQGTYQQLDHQPGMLAELAKEGAFTMPAKVKTDGRDAAADAARSTAGENGPMKTKDLPRDEALDSTLSLMREGYPFILNRARKYGRDVFRTRLLLTPAVCMTGPRAARMFYGSDRLTRRGAMPVTALTLLQDYESVQLLERADHRHRKQMFMSFAEPTQIARLCELFCDAWRSRMPEWGQSDRIHLFDEVREILCRAVCSWSAVPLRDAEIAQKARWLGAMIEGSGSAGPRNWKGQLFRSRAEAWARRLIAATRDGDLDPPPESALSVVSRHRDLRGDWLPVKTAAVELINVLRPVVAVARYIVFSALALHEHDDHAAKFRDVAPDADVERFAQEVRRLSPFFPFIGARVTEPFEWEEIEFERGEWLILDMYGTNRDPRSWREPEAFIPERFLERDHSAYDFIPQGGGDYLEGHRCPGERTTVELMKSAIRLLTQEMRYSVPAQNLEVDLSRIPALPRSGFLMSHIRGLASRSNPRSFAAQ